MPLTLLFFTRASFLGSDVPLNAADTDVNLVLHIYFINHTRAIHIEQDKIPAPINITLTLFVLLPISSPSAAPPPKPPLHLTLCHSCHISLHFLLSLSFFSCPSDLSPCLPSLLVWVQIMCLHMHASCKKCQFPLISPSVELLRTNVWLYLHKKTYFHLRENHTVWLWC